MQKNNKIYFENLDGLRFLCFLAVFFFHSFHTDYKNLESMKLYSFISEDIFGNGNLGVNFFFVLSGFLITYLLIEEKKLNKNIHLKKFWIRRILRIWPLFYFCVFFGFIIFPYIKTLFGQIPNETANLLYYLTFLNNFDIIKNGLPDSSILGILWSVAIEEQFYLVWPIILYLLPIKKYWVAFSSIIIISLVFRIYNSSYIMHEMHTLSCIGDMTIGAFGAWLIIEKEWFKEKIINAKKLYIILIYIIFAIILLFRHQIINYSSFINIIERPFIAVIIILIILEQTFSKNSFYKMSNFKRISKLGTITYGLYCLHFVGILITLNITKYFHFNTELWQVLILETSLALIITIIISKLSYRFFESPFLSLKEKFSY